MATVKYLDENGLSTVWSKVKGIVTPKADKVSGATNGHLAGLNSNGNLMDSGLPASNIAQKDGSYSGMTVGAAEDLVSAESVASEFTSRITGGSTAVGKGGTALVDKIKGRTLVWNQLVKNGDFHDGGTDWAGNPTVADGIATKTKEATGTATYVNLNQLNMPYVDGHKYFFACLARSNNATTYFNLIPSGSASDGSSIRSIIPNWTLISMIWTRTGTGVNLTLRGDNTGYPNDDISFSVKNVMCIDLTLMFGGNEPSTPEEFEALYPDPYYDYNTGTLISNAATAIETVGWNIWDEEWENCSWSAEGVKSSNLSCIGSSNRIPVLSDTSYYFILGTVPRLIVGFFLSDGSFVQYTSWITGSHRTPVGAVSMVFNTYAADAVTMYSHDICISFPDPSRNGTYEPYWRSELDLNIPTLTGKLNGTGNSVVIFPDGLRSAGTAFDEIVGNKAIKRIGAVDMGTLTFIYSTTDVPNTSIFRCALSDKKSGSANLICADYYVAGPSRNYLEGTNMAMAPYNATTSTIVTFTNSSYTDAATFKAAMSGVMLYYELATPEEYILDEAIPTAMRNDPYGTERRLPEDTAAIVTAPFRADITYSTNIKEAVQSLPQNYININSMQDFLAALGTLMGGTWTMRPADGKFDFTFTPNPSNE